MLGATFGSYRILRLIGEGGMGAVYAAEHVLLGRAAAIKVLLPEHSANAATVMRFFNEAKAATAIRHLGIVEIYDFGYTPEGSAYIAMEFLEGQSLAARMRGGILRPAQALAIVRQMAGALAAAHAKGIVHRDLKPDNVFLIADPEVAGGERIKLLDFGIAKLMPSAGNRASTNTGALLGTPTYMAPEQCRGVAVDHRVDLYALGCILFEMLAGFPPFSGEGAGDVLAAHIHVQPPLLRECAPATPAALDDLVQHLLAKDPGRRIQAAAMLISDIDGLAASVGANQSGWTTGAPARAATMASLTTLSSAVGVDARPRSRRLGVWVGLSLASAVAAGVAFAVSSSTPAEPTAEARASEPPTDEVAPKPASAPKPPAPAPTITTPPTSPAPAPQTAMPPPPAAPPPPSIAVTIDSRPTGAELLLDSKPLGTTPYRGELPPAATYLFTIRAAGYLDRTLAVDGTAPIAQTVRLQRPARRSPPQPKSNKSVNPFAD